MNSNYTSLSDDLYGMPKMMGGGGGGPPPMMMPPPPMAAPPPTQARGPSELQHLRQMVQQMAAKINDLSGQTPAPDNSKPFTKFQTWSLGMLATIVILLLLLVWTVCKYAKKMSMAPQVYSSV